MRNPKLILGGPGTGKTTYLIDRVADALEKGMDPNDIAFVSFTKAAASEAASRAAERFHIDPRDLTHFSTIHAMCFRELGMTRGMVLGPADWRIISNSVGLEITGKNAGPEDTPGGGTRSGDRCLSLMSYARATRKPLKDIWHEFGEDLDWWRLSQLERTLSEYKGDTNKVDFDDMLSLFLRKDIQVNSKLAIVDEAQDLTANQWAVVRAAFGNCPVVFIGGDDDQAIYEWSGADVDTFLRLSSDPVVLPVSHRLSLPVWTLAESINSRITQRYNKSWKPADHDGSVQHLTTLEHLEHPDGKGSWLYVARNGYMLSEVFEQLRRQGVPYRTRWGSSIDPRHVRAIVGWERRKNGKPTEAEDLELADSFASKKAPHGALWYDALTGIDGDVRHYYRAIMRRGGNLFKTPDVLVDTIHGVKGMEADNVVLMTDISRRTKHGYEVNPNTEHRVFYVGVTRARQTLYIVEPQSESSYNI